MTYVDRLQTASYESPNGDEFTFSYDTVTREANHRIGSFEFSGVNGTLHQDKGTSGEIYPLVMYFHGQNYDVIADRFLEATKQTGAGFLNHPRWGRRRIQILTVSQAENLSQRGGQAVFNVSFQETLEREFPKTGKTTQQTITTLSDNFRTNAINNFVDQVDATTLQDGLALEQDMIVSANLVRNFLSSVASSDPDIFAEFTENINDIINNASIYVDAPIEYANRIVNAVLIVADVPGRITSKLQGYKATVDTLIAKVPTGASIKIKNAFLIDEIVTTSSVVGASTGINSAFDNTSKISRNDKGRATITVPNADDGFQTRGEVLSAVVYIQDNANDVINYLDSGQVLFQDNTLSESYIQTVQSYVPSWQVASAVIKSGLDLSFSLPIKRVKTIEKSRTILDLCSEFYKNVDDSTLDYFILTNNLTGDDIILVPKGTEAVYYE